MDAKGIVHELDALHVDFYCTTCNGLMYWTYSIGHEKVLHCGRCGHEVMWAVRFEACRVDEFRPEVAYATAPLGNGLMRMSEGDVLDTDGMRVKVTT